jgi:hypothetical protein
MIEQLFVYSVRMNLTPSSPLTRPDTGRAKLSVVPRSVGADSHELPGRQASRVGPGLTGPGRNGQAKPARLTAARLSAAQIQATRL